MKGAAKKRTQAQNKEICLFQCAYHFTIVYRTAFNQHTPRLRKAKQNGNTNEWMCVRHRSETISERIFVGGRCNEDENGLAKIEK